MWTLIPKKLFFTCLGLLLLSGVLFWLGTRQEASVSAEPIGSRISEDRQGNLTIILPRFEVIGNQKYE